MARFNTRSARPAVSSPVTTTGERTATYEGATGHVRDARSELFLLAVSNMVGADTFYEKGGDRDDRYQRLVRQLAVEDPEWTAGMLRWLRSDGNMRTAAVVGAAEFAKARLDAGAEGHSRQVVDSVLQRPDEPGEMLGYWTSTYGRKLPKPVKRGVADAARRLYNERALLKYDTGSKGYRFGDVLELVHAAPDDSKPWQGELFKHAIDRRHNRDEDIPERLRTLRANAWLRTEGALSDWTDPAQLRDAGMTWEDVLSAQGSTIKKRYLWEGVIPTMGAMALVRNLRNFDEAGVSDEVAQQVVAKISDAEEVRRSRQFPFQFLAAYKHAPSLRWAYALEQALTHSLANVPALKGRTLVLVDRSGSMFGGISEKTQLNRADSAAIFGAAVALRAEAADMVEFGTNSRPVPLQRGESVLRVLDRFGSLGGTNTTQAVQQHYRGHDRVLIVTDEQAHYSYYGDPTAQVPAGVPVYTWNLAGYRVGHGLSGSHNRHTFGGLSDAAFRMVPLLEAGRDAGWPWEGAAV